MTGRRRSGILRCRGNPTHPTEYMASRPRGVKRGLDGRKKDEASPAFKSTSGDGRTNSELDGIEKDLQKYEAGCRREI